MSFFTSFAFVAVCIGVVFVIFIVATLWKNVHWVPRGISHRAGPPLTPATPVSAAPATTAGSGRVKATFGWLKEWAKVVGYVFVGVFVLWVLFSSGTVSLEMLEKGWTPSMASVGVWCTQHWLPLTIILVIGIAVLISWKLGLATLVAMVLLSMIVGSCSSTSSTIPARSARTIIPSASRHCQPFNKDEVRQCQMTAGRPVEISTEGGPFRKGEYQFCIDEWPREVNLAWKQVGTIRMRYESDQDFVLRYKLVKGECPSGTLF